MIIEIIGINALDDHSYHDLFLQFKNMDIDYLDNFY